ncbi:MAG TPA: hypothetical protein VK469_15150 [Candidatus Kapabacteria bacterium]|nr:hypothetical protein [Candidatus Kapabacteria bacterium]
MFDKELALEILSKIFDSTQTEVVFDVCENHIEDLAKTIKGIIED